jgi:hypothetical protein
MAFAEVGRWLKGAPVRAMLEIASRLGYVARGLVYLSLGTIALLAAADLAPSARGAADAVAAWAAWPLGNVLIGLIAVGLLGFSGWRFLQAVFDADGHGRSSKGLAVRAGQALSGVVHAVLAFSVFDLIDGLDDLAEKEGSSERMAQALLEAPYGDLLLIVVGAAVLALGVANLGQSLFQDFRKRLGCEGPACDWAVRLARFGYIGRTLAFAPLGFFMLEAGLDARADEAKSLGESLQVLEAQPFGSAILGVAALGLVAFGLFALMEARFRRMRVPEIAMARK